MRNSPIAVIDSGVGGLSLLKPLVQKFPNENFVYFADNEYMPYGNKSAKFLKSHLLQIVEYLQQNFNVKLVILACNTASKVALDFLNKHCSVEVLGLDLAKYSGTVLCTKLTSKLLYPNSHCLPCPSLAKYIEDNYFDKGKLQKKINSIIKANNLQTSNIILGCTHYELVSNLFAKSTTGKLILPAQEFVKSFTLKQPNLQAQGGVVIMLASIPTKSYIDKLWHIFRS